MVSTSASAASVRAPSPTLRRSVSRSPPRHGSPQLALQGTRAGGGRLTEVVGASSAEAARKAAEAAKASEAEWQRAEIESLQREAADLRERNRCLESQILSASACSSGIASASGFGNASCLSGTRARAFLSTDTGELAELRTRLEELETRHRRLEAEKLAAITKSDFIRASRVNSTTASILQDSVSSLLQERDGARARLRDDEEAAVEAQRRAVELETQLEVARTVWAEVQRRDREEATTGEEGASAAYGDESAPRTPREALQDALSGLRKQVSAQCGELERAELAVDRSGRSHRALVADCDVLRSTREALNLELADLSDRLQGFTRSRIQAAGAAAGVRAELGETSRCMAEEAKNANGRIGAAEVAAENLESRCREAASMAKRMSEEQIPTLRADVEAAGAKLRSIRTRSVADEEARLNRSSALKAEHAMVTKAVEEARSSLDEAKRDLPQLHAAAAARVTNIQRAVAAASAERNAVVAPTLHFQALAREMTARAQVLERHLERERREGDEMGREVAAAAEAGRQLQRKFSGDKGTKGRTGSRRRSSSMPIAKPLVGVAVRSRGRPSRGAGLDQENLDPTPNAASLLAHRTFSPGGRSSIQRKRRGVVH